MNPNYPDVAERASHRCEYCHAPEVIFNVPFEVDHIIPLSKNGEDDLSNLALSCRSCNLWKSNITHAVDPETNLNTPLFNPRTNNWNEHFEAKTSPPYQLKAKTSTARATINQLKLNKPTQLVARSQWILLGIYP